MKKALTVFILIVFALSLTSCVMVVKDKPEVNAKKAGTIGDFMLVKAPRPIKMFRHQGGKGKGFRNLAPGQKVRVLKMDCPFALVAAPNGDTGWVRCKVLK